MLTRRPAVDWFVAEQLSMALGAGGAVRYVLKVAWRVGVTGSISFSPKGMQWDGGGRQDALKLLPFYGWMFQLHGCVYVARDGPRADAGIPAALAALYTLDPAAWVAIFPEGTRFNIAGDAAAVERGRLFALERGLPDMTQVLMPRTKVSVGGDQS